MDRKPTARTSLCNDAAASPFWTSRRTVWLAVGAIVIAALAAYSNSFSAAFVFDDEKSISDNPSIRHLGGILFPPIRGETVTGRPVLNATLAINYAISGTNVWSYHVANLLIHIAAALLLFSILRRTFLLPTMRRRWESSATLLAFLVALIWVVHPLQTESVTYVVQRAESLMGLLYLLTLYCVIRGARSIRSRPWYVAACFACLLGMATKEVMASAPLIVFFYDRTFLAGTFRDAWRRRRGLYIGLASTWILLGWLIITGPGAVGIGINVSWHAYLCTQFGAILHYLRLCVWPRPLLIDYGGYLAEGFWEIVPYGVAVTSLGLATVVALRRWPKVGFLGLCFFAILAPSSSVVPACATQTIAEHRMYLPLAVVVLCIAIGGLRAWKWLACRDMMPPKAAQAIGAASVAFVVVLFAILTFQRNDDYRSPLSIWCDTIAKSPQNVRAYSNAGNVLIGLEENENGIAFLRKAIELDPTYAKAHNNLGAALVKTGQIDDALRSYRRAIEIIPNYADAFNNLGEALAGRGQTDEAVVCFRKAIEYSPTHAAAYNNLGAALAGRGQIGDAESCYRKAIEYNPRCAGAYCNLGVVHINRGQLAEAIALFQKALECDGSLAKAYNNLGAALASSGRMDEAVFCYQRAIALSLQPAEAYCNLGVALAGRGQLDKAIVHFRKALEYQPDYADAHYHLGNALATRGNLDEAAPCYQQAIEHNPGHADACHNLGAVLAAQGRMDDAVANYRKAITIRPDYAKAHYNLAAALAKTSRFAEAIVSYRKALELQPDARTCNSLALLLATCPDASMRNGAEAVRLAERASELSQRNDPVILDALAAAYAETGRFDDARSIAQQALAIADRQRNTSLANVLRGRIALYERREPCREGTVTFSPAPQPSPKTTILEEVR